MRDSQYAAAYLDSGYTIATYLNQHLHGKAKQYGGRYAVALLRTLERWEADGRAFRGPSVKGGVAFYSRPQTRRRASAGGQHQDRTAGVHVGGADVRG